MQSTNKSEQCLLDIKDHNGDILKYFALGIELEKFRGAKTLKLRAQSFFNPNNIRDFDFFQPTLPFPVFSTKAKEIIAPKTDDIEFISCTIAVEDTTIEAFAGRILNRKPLFERVDDYSIKLQDKVKLNEEDLIVRDSSNEQFYIVSEKFRDLCLAENLRISFIEFSMFK
ncbi:hypothetical protein [Chitinolyticbacter albus]|uniref:hypothetical protein n=1 Tax=Chitinolyticbacter albus TaxID=2961951 RepID=UPI00210A5465|nr:hypothetical protein [Chitinolyticbacter albus]